jgi:branched-chain amino acid transport system substrate-binding protein
MLITATYSTRARYLFFLAMLSMTRRPADRLFAMTGANRRVAHWACGPVALALGVSLLAAPFAGAQTPAVKIAVPTALTGSGQFVGRALLEVVQFAVEETNAAGDAPRIELEVVDDRSTAEGARAAAQQIAAGDALVVVGPSLTGSALAAGPIYAEAGIASLPPTAQGDAITNNATSFRAMISAGEMGDALANYLHYVVGGTRAVVLYLDNGYGRPFADGFKRVAERHGIAGQVSCREDQWHLQAQNRRSQRSASSYHQSAKGHPP